MKRFVKAVRRRDIQPGDVVCGRKNRTHTVHRVFAFRGSPSVLNIHCTDEAMLSGNPDDIIGLVGRPRPEGMTRQDMLERVQLYARILQGISEVAPEVVESHIKTIFKVIEDYELGKLFDDKK